MFYQHKCVLSYFGKGLIKLILGGLKFNCNFYVTGSPSFVLGVILSNNKFTATDVKNRWTHLVTSLESIGIQTISVSTDGDSRYFAAMKSLVNFGEVSTVYQLICPINISGCLLFIQDLAHKINNMRNRFYNLSVDMRMGNYLVSVNHLFLLLEKVSKNVHLLCASDLNNEDRMNFKVIYKITTNEILQNLFENVANSAGTIEFLRIMRFLLDAFMEEKLSVQQRISQAFYSLTFLRIWRYYCTQTRSLDNFITRESYEATEINVWTLLKLVLICRDKLGPQFFQVTLLNSQVCEKFFRILRSNTSTFSTIVNFSGLELLERIQRVQIQEEILNDLKNKFIFRENLTRSEKSKTNFEKMPTNEELSELIADATKGAMEAASKLGILIIGQEETSLGFNIIYSPSTTQPPEKKIVLVKETEGQRDKIFKFKDLRFKNEVSGISVT